jgi:hypothetical protein
MDTDDFIRVYFYDMLLNHYENSTLKLVLQNRIIFQAAPV